MPRNANAVGYNANPLLPLPNVNVALTAHELSEYIHCEADPIYFIEHYVKISNVDEGIIKFTPYNFQKDIIRTLESKRFVIAKLPRQCGKSTVIVCGYFLWYILFHTDVSVAILANTEETAKMLVRRMKGSFELLPMFLKQGVEKWDETQIILANKARVRAAATSGSAIRGDTFNIVFLDEFAFIPANIALEFMASVFPAISSGKKTKLFIVSTPQGYNLFHKLFTEAEKGKNAYTPLAYTWRDTQKARGMQTEDELQKWREETLRMLNNNLQKFQQEFECDFLGSANTLVAPWKIQQLMQASYLPLENRGKLRVYQPPIVLSRDSPAHVYIVLGDVAEGQDMDSSVLQVIDITSSPFCQVATFQDNTIKPAQLAPIAAQIGHWYNNAYMFFEINGVAFGTAQILHEELAYENIIQVRMDKRLGQKISSGFNQASRIGLKSSEATKKIGCTGLKSLMENDKLELVDYETITQMGTFVAKISKLTGLATGYAAEPGNHDDTVTPLVLLGWLTMQGTMFEDYVGLNMRQQLMAGDRKSTAPPKIDDDLKEPLAFFMDDGQGPTVLGQGPWGIPIVEDTDFWLK